jgi:hypothetical protein
VPGAFKPKEVTPVQKLAYYWTRLDETTKGYFEHLYALHPVDVSELLAGEALLPAGSCRTLQDWVDGKGTDEEAITAFSFESVYINISALKIVPEFPQAGEAFKIVWEGEAQTDFHEREDTVEITDGMGDVVKTLTLTYPETGAGAINEEIDVDGLPDGSYNLLLTVNVDGTEHGTELTERGLRSGIGQTFFVGESEDAFRARITPAVTEIISLGSGLFTEPIFGPRDTDAVARMLDLVTDLDRGGSGFDGPLTEIASKLESAKGMVGQAREGQAYAEMDPERRAGFTTLRERMSGMLMDVYDISKFQERFYDWMQEYAKVA